MTLRPAQPLNERYAFALLRAGVPLTLLLDLANGDPRSAEIYAMESCRKAS